MDRHPQTRRLQASHPQWRPQAIVSILCECGRNAMSGRGRGNWSLKSDGSLVTALDLRNESLLRERLTSLMPGSGFLGEETLAACTEEEIAAAFQGDCWVVDPIDGTAPFANGFPCWAVSIGLMHRGTLVDGGVILPEEGVVMVTQGADVLCARGVGVSAGDIPGLERFTALAPLDDGRGEAWDNGRMLLLGQEIARRYSLAAPNPLLVTGSAVYAIASLLMGRALAYIGTLKLYDVAGMMPMAARLGCGMSLDGTGPFGLAVTDDVFHLSPGDEDRWKIRGLLTVASNAVLPYVSQNLLLERH